MTASELNDKLDMCISCGHGDDEVVIHCREQSIGPSAAETVSGIYAGFDWDDGRLIIEPEKSLIHYGSGRDDPMPAVRVTYKEDRHGKIKPTLHCPRCEAEITEKMRYCPKCGQMLDIEQPKEVKL